MAWNIAKKVRKCYYMTEMTIIDAIDEQLVKLLQQDARQSSSALAKQLHVSPSAVRRRTRELIKNGTIRIVAVTDPGKLGLNLSAFVALNVDKEVINDIVKALSALKSVTDIFITTGRFDIITRVQVTSVDELSHILRTDVARIEGIRRREVLIYMERVKTRGAQRKLHEEVTE